MKNSLKVMIVVLAITLAFSATATLDITGDWDVQVSQEEVGGDNYTPTWTFAKLVNGTYEIATTQDEIFKNGVLSGNQFTAPITYARPWWEGGGPIIMTMELTFSPDGNSFTGFYGSFTNDKNGNMVPFKIHLKGLRHIVRPPYNMDSGTRFSSISGEVGVRPHSDETAWKPAKLSTILEVDNHVITGEDSSCILSFSDMTTFTMRPESEIILNTPAEKDSKLKLLAGKIWVNVKKMIKDGSMDIEMNEAVAGIKGTILVCEETGGSSTVKVIDGTVSFTSKATGEVATINAGEKATATSSGLSQPQPFEIEAENADWEKYTPASGAAPSGAGPVYAGPGGAGGTHEAPLSPGWGIFDDPFSNGKVSWTVLDDGKLQVIFELNGARPNHWYLVGAHLWNPSDITKIPEVEQFGGWKLPSGGLLTVEGNTVNPDAWDFGYLNTTENGDGAAQFILTPSPGTYYVQFTVRIGATCMSGVDTSGCAVVYRTGDKCGEGFEVITIGGAGPIGAIGPESQFKTFGDGTLYMFGDIPFQVVGGDGSPASPLLRVDLQNNNMQNSFDLSGYSAGAIHILERAGWGLNVPDNVIVGNITVYYQDGTSTAADLISGVNIAEWAYDRKENAKCLKHAKILPAYSWPTTVDTAEEYYGHVFYAKIDTQPGKPLDRLELRLDPGISAYTTGGECTPDGWYAILIHAITLESRAAGQTFTSAAAPSGAGPGGAGPGAVEWPISAGGNGHYYEAVFVPEGITWDDAKAAAEAKGGHLVTITSEAENEFVYNLASDDRFWYIVPQWEGTVGPWLGGYQPPGLPEPAGGWTWVTGEPFSYSNWQAGEPNNYGSGEDSLMFYSYKAPKSPHWNDAPHDFISKGYIVEWEGSYTQ